ncbi:MAG: M48 family metalloprotease [Candidatus Berkelbacteria bacterium]|nr:MAG: M48 family metalloprotease [Candidatus Berkelbacteria bacterium]QQG51560.1 MAG: M48 family metalloprotease [Candidatus Berkelbacteria bacterium]
MYNEIAANRRRTFYMFFVFLMLIIGIGWALSYIYENQAILYFALAIALFQGWLSYFFADSIALSVTGAKVASREQFPELHRLVENLSITAGLPKPRLYVIDDPSPNAFATGRSPEHAAVAVTTGILQLLEKRELEGVIAHEMSHIGNRDILVMTVAVTLVGTIVLVSDIMTRSWFWRSRDDNDSRAGGIGALVAIALAILAPLFAQLIQLAVSRKREYLADATGALMTRFPEGLAQALEKIERYERPMKSANRATAHLFINEPFGVEEQKSSWLSTVFSTHPPIPDRVKKLRSML